MKGFVIAFFVLFFNSSIVQSQEWLQKASIPTAGRYHGIAFTIDNSAFVGMGQLGNTKANDIWEYNQNSNTWTQRANYPGLGRYAATSFVINGKGYVCMGSNSSNAGQNDLWEYDATLDTWTQRASFPGIGRIGASCFVLGDTAFIGTGSYNNPNDYLTDFWMYIPAQNTWTQLADVPGGHRNHGVAFALGDYGYIGSGLSNNSNAKSDYWRYDKTTNTWASIADYPGEARMGTVSLILQDKALVGTGFDFSNRYNDFYEYDPTNNTWSYLTSSGGLPARHAGIAFNIGVNCYVGTGYTTPNTLPDLWIIKQSKPTAVIESNHLMENNIVVYPNPTKEKIIIDLGELQGSFEIFLYSTDGKLVMEETLSGKRGTLYLSDIKPGSYQLLVKNTENSYTQTVIIE